MLNFYNYYGKIHPELMRKLKELEEKASGNNNVLVIRPESTKNTPFPLSDAYVKGMTLYYDDSGENSSVNINSNVQINITKEMLFHIIENVDKIIFYLSGGTPYEGLVYEKMRIRRNIWQSTFYHISHDPLSSNYNDSIDDTIVCGIYGNEENEFCKISKAGHPR